MKNRHLFLIPIIFLCTSVTAQVAVNADGAAPDNSAMLDVKSSTLQQQASRAWDMNIYSGNTYFGNNVKSFGMSLRCLRD